MSGVHDLAIIRKNVSLGDEVKVGPYAVIGDNVKIGNGTVIESHAIVRSGTIIGDGCFVDSFAAIGGLPQDESFDVIIHSGVIVGNDAIIRERVTIHRSTNEAGSTKIGNSCMLQSGAHVAHDCEVGDHTILASGSMLGGKVKSGQKCFLGGGATVHQNVVVGDYVILSGNSATAFELPPYVMAAEVSTIIGLNLVRLRHEKVENGSVIALKDCFWEFYKRNGSFEDRAKAMIESEYGRTYETLNFRNFFLEESK
jgi:UDP-N-acetylglucosamine acyltransferase